MPKLTLAKLRSVREAALELNADRRTLALLIQLHKVPYVQVGHAHVLTNDAFQRLKAAYDTHRRDGGYR